MRWSDRNVDTMKRRDEIKAAADRIWQEIDPDEWLALIEVEQEQEQE